MARKQQAILCTSCEAPLRHESSFCPNCGRPTVWATHDERVQFEVRQWRASRAREGEKNGLMMLVRTEEGYTPAPDQITHYTWDQPLHPERENVRNKNPHAAPKSAPKEKGAENGNGNGSVPAPPVVSPEALATAPTTAPWVAAAVAEANGTRHVMEDPAAGIARLDDVEIAPAVQAPVIETPAPAPAPAATEDVSVAPSLTVEQASPSEVKISKWAVALGIALAVGLPLSGNLIDLSKSSPSAARRPARAAAAPIAPVAVAVARSGFGRASADAARYAVVVRNPNRGFTARSVTVTTSLLDRSGRVVGTAIDRVAYVAPGAKVAVAGQTGVSASATRLVSTVSTGAFEGGVAPRAFSVGGVRLSRSAGGVTVRATVSGPAARDAKVVVVYLDRAGHVLGGDFAYVDVPAAPRSAGVVVSTGGVRGVARVEVLVAPTR